MRWKVIAAVLVLSVLDVLNYFVWQAGALPQNRGNITAAQYAENFNHLQEFYQIDHQMNHPEFLPPYNDSMKRLNQYGDWEKMDGNGMSLIPGWIIRIFQGFNLRKKTVF